MASFLKAFLRADPPPFDGLELRLAAPQRGHTVTLVWEAADGELVTAGQTLFRQISDADPQDEQAVCTPLPARVTILQAAARFLPPGQPVCRLAFGYPLEAELRKEWRELAFELAAELGGRLKTVPVPPLPPRALLKLVFLDFTLVRALERAGLRPPPAVIPADLREDRALTVLEQLSRWKIAAVRASAPSLPDTVAEHTVLLWENLFANMAATLRHDGLAAEDGLTPDGD